MAQQVWLGLAGDLCSQDTPSDHYTTRIGGLPMFPGAAAPQWKGSTCPSCAVCGGPLPLVLQAYAPLPDLPDRALLLLGCTSSGCGKGPGCWQAVRCQLQPPAQDPQQQQQKQQQKQHQQQQHQQQNGCDSQPAGCLQPSTGQPGPTGFDALDAPGFSAAGATDTWGFGGDTAGGSSSSFGGWDAVQPPGSNGSDAFDFSDLTSALAATAQKQQEHQQREAKKKKQQQQQQQQVTDTAAGDVGPGAGDVTPSTRGAAGPELPEFYLMAEPEPGASSVKGISRQELQHVQQLLAAYEAAEGPAGTAAAAAGAASSSQSSQAAAAAAAGGGGSAADTEGEGGASWAGEEYEPDSVSCMQRSYLKFMKRIARQPQQCARYAHNGPLLWPKAQLPQPNPCPMCGGPRVFELQLMPALSQMVLEAAVMMQEQQLAVNAAVVNAVANWDWCTVAVFTCQASCCASNGSNTAAECRLAVEEVFVVTEAECENQPGTAAAAAAAAAAVGVPVSAVAGTSDVAASVLDDEEDTATED